MSNSTLKSKFPLAFFVLTFIISLPFYILVALASQNIIFTPEMAFFFISLATLVPIAAALILTFKENGWDGAKKLLGRSFDLKRIAKKIWYVPALFLLPFVFMLALGLMVLIGKPIPAAQFPVAVLPVLFLVFFIMALGEEVGWMGYAFEPMQYQQNAFKATLVLGLIWAIWHVPLYIFMMTDPVFIVAQVLCLLGIRFLLVWVFNNTGGSVFAAILFHTVYNATNGVLPNYQVSTPLGIVITSSFVLITAILVTILWGSKTMTRFRYTRLSKGV
ncbi:CPBP family intramembrane glutamic endopeptidase [Chloroflexota bacterium]